MVDLMPCPHCYGTGCEGVRDCLFCGGTGGVRTEPATPADDAIFILTRTACAKAVMKAGDIIKQSSLWTRYPEVAAQLENVFDAITVMVCEVTFDPAWNTRPEPVTPAGDDALVETDPYSVVDEMLEYFDSYSLAAWAPVAAIIERERAAAHAAGRAAERAKTDLLLDVVQTIGDNVANVFDQMLKGNWRDDHDHDVRLNKAMRDLKNTMMNVMELRAKHFDYSAIERGQHGSKGDADQV